MEELLDLSLVTPEGKTKSKVYVFLGYHIYSLYKSYKYKKKNVPQPFREEKTRFLYKTV